MTSLSSAIAHHDGSSLRGNKSSDKKIVGAGLRKSERKAERREVNYRRRFDKSGRWNSPGWNGNE
jgi:hypothetical protein